MGVPARTPVREKQDREREREATEVGDSAFHFEGEAEEPGSALGSAHHRGLVPAGADGLGQPESLRLSMGSGWPRWLSR